VVELPAGFTSCSRCGAQDATIFFRGWSRLYAFWLSVNEARSSAYACGECATKETTKSLFVTALRGWWALPSIFWYAPKSTYFNWRSVWAPPRNSLTWGAMPLDELMEAIARDRRQEPQEEPAFIDSPLDDLSPSEQQRVLNAPDLYAPLKLGAQATAAEIKAAWREQAKANHPDLNQGDPSAAARMLAVNRAYEILGDPRMRAAYDWLIASGSRPS
jgi:DnaJ-domain-containing protein 1